MVINIIFLLCLLFPILRLKNELLNLLNYLLSRLFRYDVVHESDVSLVDLPVIRFEDLENRRHGSIDQICLICSADYKNDVLCQLSRCGDVFHSDCVRRLLHRKDTFCPFCRSPIFAGLPPPPCNSY